MSSRNIDDLSLNSNVSSRQSNKKVIEWKIILLSKWKAILATTKTTGNIYFIILIESVKRFAISAIRGEILEREREKRERER